MIRKNIFALFLFLSISIYSQESTCKIQLENFNRDKKVFQFFEENFLQKDDIKYETESGKSVSATVALKEYGETHYITRKEVFFENPDRKYTVEGEKKIKIGNLYSINRYTNTDKAACYGKLWFSAFEILVSSTDQFIALIAENRNTTGKDFQNLLIELEKKVPLKKVDSRNFEISIFDFGKYLIQFKETKNSYRSESSYAYPAEIAEKKVDLTLVIIQKSATEKQLIWLNDINN